MAVLERIVGAAAARPRRVLAVALALVALAVVLALRLAPSSAPSTIAGRGSDAFQATERLHARFGDEAVAVLVRGDLPQLVLTANLGRLMGLEGCLSGNKPAGAQPPGGPGSPCDRLAREQPVQVVYGPGTFINSAVTEIQDQLTRMQREKAAEAQRAASAAREVARRQGRTVAEQGRLAASAKQLVYAEFLRDVLALSNRYGLPQGASPQIDNVAFVSALVFDAARGAATPKARFASLFPSSRAAAIQVRLKPGLSDGARDRAIDLVRAAVAMPQFRLDKGSYVVTGSPVLARDLTDALAGSTLRLLVVGLVLMGVVLALAFRGRPRLLPLAIALGAVALTFGGTSLLGAPLTMASIAALPVLLGLGVDYAIQYQARAREHGAAGAAGAARAGVPAIATAALATAVGFLVLLASPVPMVRGFGVLLVAGVGFALALALTAGTAALALAERRRRRRAGGALAGALRGAGELVDAAARALARPFRRLGRVGGAVLSAAMRRPGRVLAVGLAVAAVGWAVDSQTEVVSDVDRLVPQDLPAVADLHAFQQATGVVGELDVLVEADDLTDPKAIGWMRAFQADALARYGYGAKTGCERAELCPALSLPDLFRTRASYASRENVRALLDAVPPYFSRAVISGDRRSATLAFGIRLASLERQHEIAQDLRARLRPPGGVTATLAGLPVLASDAGAALASPWRRLATLAGGLLVVALALLGAARLAGGAGRGSWREAWDRAWVPLVPIALATGWSALVLFALRVPLNPMSATLGALVVAISTEFAVLLAARHRQERAAGAGPEEALARTYRSTGAAVAASGATAIAGFAVLAFSDVRMLRDFGLVTVVDLTVSLLGVLAVLPAALVLAERRAARDRAASPPPPARPAERSGPAVHA